MMGPLKYSTIYLYMIGAIALTWKANTLMKEIIDETPLFFLYYFFILSLFGVIITYLTASFRDPGVLLRN